MSTESEERLAEAVRKYPALYDKQDKNFRDKNKKRLAWADVAKELNIQNVTEVEKAFRNFRSKYGKAKKKWNSLNKSGAGAKEARRPPLLEVLGWLEPYIVERGTSSNWSTSESVAQEEDDDRELFEGEQFDQEEEDGDIEEDGGNDGDNESVISEPVTNPPPLLSNKSKQNVSDVTGRQKFQKGATKRKAELETNLVQVTPTPKMTISFMVIYSPQN
ncbi:uncharacterized protein LOC130625792 [Hydractinia symbiolongicarpus]|uniref:uncharacterized protein LOC130625792 n=1 Tax=Hydractinia symbiolongicarpus TaxID=13093 RepID=UPI00254D27A1|nr:uncharacterized protein LOC130625792 [Hydractinia symbiolongicarpus]